MRVLLCCAAAETAASTVNSLLARGHEVEVFDRWSDMLQEARSRPCDAMVLELLAALGPGGAIEPYERFAEEKMGDPKLSPVPLILIALPPDEEAEQMVGWPGFLYAYLRHPMDPDAILRVLSHLREGAMTSA
ncbi:MAG: hypothetical protein AMXMBFR61_16040 [Fimbriimonadales bacterium]